MNIILPPGHTIVRASATPNTSADLSFSIAKSPAGRIQDSDQLKTAVDFFLPKTKYSQNVAVLPGDKNSSQALYHVIRYIPQSNKLTVSTDKP